MSNTPLLSIGMIVKNEIRCLEKCLKALQPLRDAIPCELVIADTGSTDGTREIAEQYADILFDFAWVNDFAAARNAVIKRCSGKWYMSLDADEYLKDIDELVKFFNSSESDYTDFASYIVRNHSVPSMNGTYNDFPAVRIARMHPDLHYEGIIHEIFAVPKGAKLFQLRKTIFDHDGYCHLSPEHLKKKAERNLVLLEQTLEADPNDPKCLLQCVDSSAVLKEKQDYYIRRSMDTIMGEENEKAYEYWSTCAPPIVSASIDYAESAQLPEIEDWYQWAMEKFSDSYFIKIDANYHYLRYLHRKQQYHEIPAIADVYLHTVEKYNAFGVPGNEGLISPIRFATPDHVETIRLVLADAYGKTGKKRQMIDYLNTLDVLELNDASFVRWFSYFEDHADFPMAQKTLVRKVLPFYEKRENGSDAEKRLWNKIFVRIQKAFVLNNPKSMDLCQLYTAFPGVVGVCAKLIYTQTAEEGQALLNQIEDWSILLPLALQQAMKLRLVFPDAFYRIAPERLHGLQNSLAQHCDDIAQYALYYSEPEQMTDWYRLCFAFELLCVVCMQQKNFEGAYADALCDRLPQICARFLQEYYHPNVLADESTIARLPALHRFAWYLTHATKLQQVGDEVGFLGALRSALEQVKPMKPVIQQITERIKKQQEQERQERIKTAPPELLALAEQVKTILAAYPADDPAVVALKQTPAYQQVAFLIEEPNAVAQ